MVSRAVFDGAVKALPSGHDSWTKPLVYPGAQPPLLGPGRPSLFFICDMADLFFEKRPQRHIDKVVSTFALSNHIGLVLTKRVDAMAAYFTTPQSDNTLRLWRSKFWLGFSAPTGIR